MNYVKVINRLAVVLISFSALSILMVSLMAFGNPQSVMDLVQVQLPNNDAYSSIRGVYGGAGITFFIIFIYLAVNNIRLGLGVLSAFWGFYALSRIITIMAEGPLGDFGTTWLRIESLLAILAITLYILKSRVTNAQPDTVLKPAPGQHA